MPVLAFFLPLWGVKRRVFFHLHYKPYLSAVAEVTDYQAAYFLYEGLSCEFQFVLAFFNQIFNFIRLQLHYASNRKFTCPLTLVQVPENTLHISCLMFRGPAWDTFSSQVHYQLIAVLIVLTNDLIFLTFFLGNHPFFKFKQNRVQLARGLFDVRHRGFQLINRGKTAHALLGALSMNATLFFLVL